MGEGDDMPMLCENCGNALLDEPKVCDICKQSYRCEQNTAVEFRDKDFEDLQMGFKDVCPVCLGRILRYILTMERGEDERCDRRVQR